MSIRQGNWLGPLLFGLLTLNSSIVSGQVPIHGITGTIAPQASVDKFYSGVNTLLVETSDAVEHLVHVTKRTKVNSDTASLDSLHPGKVVVVRYIVKGIQTSAGDIDRIRPDSLKLNEGTVTSVDRSKKQVAIRFADGARETLRLARDIEDSHGHGRSRVVMYYSDESGQRVVRYFKPPRR